VVNATDFTKKLLFWHRYHKRNLPWKTTSDPYKIWLSEIILQQTRVEQGLSYYKNLTRQFPTVKKLATSSEDEVMRAWQGLGYYSRARNMHQAAKQIITQHKGKFPDSYQEILRLKGVGEYTASAISSFAYNLPHAVVDGNVYRVLARAFGIRKAIDTTSGRKHFKQLANELLHKKNPAAYNQAIMDFGATVCTPANPHCTQCFFKTNCVAHSRNWMKILPVKLKRTSVKTRWFNFFVIMDEDRIIVEKRNSKDIWKGLYQFPLLETEKKIEADRALAIFSSAHSLKQVKLIESSAMVKHLLSHQTILAQFLTVKTSHKKNFHSENWKIADRQKLYQFAFPKLIDNYIKKRLH